MLQSYPSPLAGPATATWEMTWAQRLLLPDQRPQVHLLRLSQLALVRVQGPKAVDGAEGRRVVRSQRLQASAGRTGDVLGVES
jgi:glycine cleavage system aminomethyltransferase T